MIARLHRSDACSHLANNPGTLMTEDRRKDSFAVEAVKCIGVGVTNAGRLYFDKDFAGFRAIQIKLNDFKRLFCFERDSSASLHGNFSLIRLTRGVSRQSETGPASVVFVARALHAHAERQRSRFQGLDFFAML